MLESQIITEQLAAADNFGLLGGGGGVGRPWRGGGYHGGRLSGRLGGLSWLRRLGRGRGRLLLRQALPWVARARVPLPHHRKRCPRTAPQRSLRLTKSSAS